MTINDHPTARHPGWDETIRKAAKILKWPGMHQWISNYVKGCANCQQNKILTHQRKVPLYQITTKEGTLPFQQIAMDLIIGLPQQDGHNAILTIIDHGCSQVAIFLPCSNTITGPGIAHLYLDHIYWWFGLPSHMISDRDPRFTSHFEKALMDKLGILQNLSTAFHPQTNGLSERKNQWIEQYLCLITSMDPKGWVYWLALATAVHNNQVNTTTGLSPNQILLGYNPILNTDETLMTLNALVESRSETMKQNHRNAIWALNKTSDQKGPPPLQYKLREQVWLDVSHLKLPHQKAKLTLKHLGPFKITKEVSPMAYCLVLPANWRIHDVFHTSLLNPYHETTAHAAHWHFGWSKCLQYLIKWKGYPKSDNTWEPADQVHTPQLIKLYQSTAGHQSSIKVRCVKLYQSTGISQSAAKTRCLKEQWPILQSFTKCPVLPASQSLHKSLQLFSRKPNLTSPPCSLLSKLLLLLASNLAPFTSSGIITNSPTHMLPHTAGIVSSTTAPTIIPTRICQIMPSMPLLNPLPTPLVPLQSLVQIASSLMISLRYPSLVPATLPSPSTPINLWDDSPRTVSATSLKPTTWTYLHTEPSSKPLSSQQTDIRQMLPSNWLSRQRNIKKPSTKWRKTSIMPTPVSLGTKKCSRPLPKGMLLTPSSPHLPSLSERVIVSLPSGSNNLTMAKSLDMEKAMEKGTSLMS